MSAGPLAIILGVVISIVLNIVIIIVIIIVVCVVCRRRSVRRKFANGVMRIVSNTIFSIPFIAFYA